MRGVIEHDKSVGIQKSDTQKKLKVVEFCTFVFTMHDDRLSNFDRVAVSVISTFIQAKKIHELNARKTGCIVYI